MKKFLQKETGKLISWLRGLAAMILVIVFSSQSTPLFAYSTEDFNNDLRETAATASAQSNRLISAPLSLYTGYILSDDFIKYAKSVGVDPGNADRWLTESRVISTFFNAFSLYLSYEKSDSIGMTANSIKVLLNLATLVGKNPIPPPWGPIVNLLITGAQTTAESYLAVQQTGREVDIERLYFLLRQDKKLRPEKGDLINMDTRENVNYIFDKFLIGGNSDSRQLINSYLVEKLGKSIPTEDIHSANFADPTGNDDADVEMTVEQFYAKNKGDIDTYIAALLKEVNLLLKAQFEEINLRKEFIAQKPLLEELARINKQYGNIVEKTEDMKRINSELTQKYAKLAQNFNARLADAKSKNTGTAAREVRDEAQYAIMTIEEKGYYAEDPRAEFLNKALGGDKLIEYLTILRPGFKQAAALAKALGQKEDAEEKKAYEEYVKNSQAIIQGFASFKLDKYPLDAKLAEWKEAIDKYYRTGGTYKGEILEALGVKKTAEEVDSFYKKQWEEQKKANIEKFKEVDRLWQNVNSRWEKSEEYLSLVGTKPSDAVFNNAQAAFYKRRDEKYAEINKIRGKVSAAWGLFCKELEQNSGFSVGSITGSGGDATSDVLSGEGFYKFMPLINERTDEWEKIRLLSGAEQAEIFANARPPADLMTDPESWITLNNKIIASSQNWKIPESSFGKVPGIEGADLKDALQKLQDSLSGSGGGVEDFENYFDNRFSVEADIRYSLLKGFAQKVDERIKELDQFIETWAKACAQSEAAYSKWKLEFKSGPDQTLETAKKLRDSFKKFKGVVPEALQNLERAYANLYIEAADREAFIRSRIVLVKALLSLPLFMNFEQIKNEVKPGVPLKASYLYAGEKGYLSSAQVKNLQGAMAASLTAERMKALAAMAPKLHKQAEEARNFAAKIKFVGDKDVVGLDGSAVTISEQQAQLNKAQTISELNALGWERILADNGIDIDSDNVFAVHYRKRLGELKEKEDEANKMVQKASMPVAIKSVKINGEAFTGEAIDVDFAKDKIIKITGEIESGVRPREVTVSTEKTDFVKGNLGSSSERDGKVFTTFSYDLPVGVVAGTSGKVTITSSAGGSNGYQELTFQVGGAFQENVLAGLNDFLDEARKIKPEGDYRAKFNQIREKMMAYLKDSGLSPGLPEVGRIMNEVSTIESALSRTTSPVPGPSGPLPAPMGPGDTTGKPHDGEPGHAGGPNGQPGSNLDQQGPGGQGGPGGFPGGGPGGMGSPMGSPVLAEFYKLYDARLNTRSLQNASGGDVVVTTADLRSGGIEVTARLSTMERIQTLLISEDDGRTWTELPVNQNLTYRFTPMAEKRYQLVLKIKTTDSQEATFPFFPNINAIVYRNISYTDLVQDVVTKIANAYESQNTATFAALISRDYLGNRVYLEEGVRFDFDMFTDIRLKIFIDRMEQRGDLYLADTHWEKSQNPRKTGQQQMTTGRTVMTFALEDGSLKIKNLRGDLIYATLSPQIAESSGLSQAVVEEIRVANFERIPVQPGAGKTVNSGGVSQTLSVRNGTVHAFHSATPPPPSTNNSFAFAAGTESTTATAGDIQLEYDGVATFAFEANAPAKIQEVTGTYTFANLNTAPAIADAGTVFLSTGDVLLLVTTQGYYCKIEITSVTGDGANATAQFNYAVQTDGSRNLSTS